VIDEKTGRFYEKKAADERQSRRSVEEAVQEPSFLKPAPIYFSKVSNVIFALLNDPDRLLSKVQREGLQAYRATIQQDSLTVSHCVKVSLRQEFKEGRLTQEDFDGLCANYSQKFGVREF
jgi:hypothetical protein